MKINIYKPLFFVTLVLVVIFIAAGGVYSSFQQQIDYGYSVEVRVPVQGGGMTLYANPACTNLLIPPSQISGFRGDSFAHPIYIKNTGDIPLDSVSATLDPVTVSFGTVSLMGGQSTSLAVGSVKVMQFSLTISTTAVAGNYTTGKIIIIGQAQ